MTLEKRLAIPAGPMLGEISIREFVNVQKHRHRVFDIRPKCRHFDDNILLAIKNSDIMIPKF